MGDNQVQFEEDEFDLYTDPTKGDSTPIRLFTWRNSNNISVQVINYGATVTSLKVPGKNGAVEDVVLGFDDLKGYMGSDNPYFGATIGRVANRIGNGQVRILGTIFNVTKNLGENQLHGGIQGFDKAICKNCPRNMSGVTLNQTNFGSISDAGKTKQVDLFTWTNKKVSIQVMTYGATIVTIKLPDKKGAIQDIITGFDNVEGYLGTSNRFFGATVGRVANRINKGKLTIGKLSYNLTTNNGANQLHGRFKGFDKVVWDYYVDGTKLILSYHSADLEEGYPGDLVVNVSFQLTANNEFNIEFKATTTKPTVVNLTNHSYFNLAGHNSGAAELYKHVVCINADRITETNAESIPTGVVTPVAGTIFDLQVPKALEDVIHKVPNRPGYDNNFCITKGSEQGTTFIARVHHPESGRVMEIYSNQPGVQFYTSNALPEKPDSHKAEDKKVAGKEGSHYYKHAAFCLETQKWPDAPNHDNFPSALLYPGDSYYHYVSYRFSIKDEYLFTKAQF